MSKYYLLVGLGAGFCLPYLIDFSVVKQPLARVNQPTLDAEIQVEPSLTKNRDGTPDATKSSSSDVTSAPPKDAALPAAPTKNIDATPDATKSTPADVTSAATKDAALPAASALNASRPTPRYLLGFSTGHAGSTTVDKVIGSGRGCPWEKRAGKFETSVSIPREIMNLTQEKQCHWVETEMVHQMKAMVEAKHNATFIDLGHFYNMGYIMECLATSSLAKQDLLAWVHIRRNRHAIARSFANRFETPCRRKIHTQDRRMKRHKKHNPTVSYCPHSKDDSHNTPIYLLVPDEVWMELTPFQKFLWQADEIEYRFYKFQQELLIPNKERYYEVSWDFGYQLEAGLANVKEQLGCAAPKKVPNTQGHVGHGNDSVPCRENILQDLEYRTRTNYPKDVQNLIFQYTTIDSFELRECEESKEELEEALAKWGG